MVGKPPAFLSTLSLRRATTSRLHKILAVWDFYPRSPCGERPITEMRVALDNIFLSTLSLRRATLDISTDPTFSRYFYPRSPCGERRQTFAYWYIKEMISIHALLAESDPCLVGHGVRIAISIHALLAESDPWTRPPKTGTCISIHALLAESDNSACCGVRRKYISIHALLAESDDRQRQRHPHTLDFYPRSPCGERRQRSSKTVRHFRYFYPRSPCGERPIGKYAQYAVTGISIHALLAESDLGIPNQVGTWEVISIHALLAESDLAAMRLSDHQFRFLSTLSLRRATVIR